MLRIAVETDALAAPGTREVERLCRGLLGALDHRGSLAARNERSVLAIATVGEELADRSQSARALQRAAPGEPHQRKRRIDRSNRIGDGVGDRIVDGASIMNYSA